MDDGRDRWPRFINYLAYAFFVLFVLVALAAVLLPMLSRTGHDARGAACLNNLKHIMTAIKTYSQDYGEYFPSSSKPGEPIQVRAHYRDLGMLYPKYVTSLDVFTCPYSSDRALQQRDSPEHDNRPFSEAEARCVSYAYSYDGSDGKNVAWTEGAPSTTRILADRPASRGLTRHSNHKTDGRHVAFHDGHVRWISGKARLLTDPDNPDPKINDKSWWSER